MSQEDSDDSKKESDSEGDVEMKTEEREKLMSLLSLMTTMKDLQLRNMTLDDVINKLDNETNLERLKSVVFKIRTFTKTEENKSKFGNTPFFTALIRRMKMFIDFESSKIRVSMVAILNNFIESDVYRKYMVEGGVIPAFIDLMDALSSTTERKVIVKMMSIIAEDVWYREAIVNYVNEKYPVEYDKTNWKNRILDDPVDIDEREFFLDVLKFTDIIMDAYKPGMVAFYNPSDFPICKILEENFEAIRDEVFALHEDNLVPWPEKYLCKTGWDVLGMFAFNNKIPKNNQVCPKTYQILESIPGMVTAMFSCLKPRSHIKPHIGYYQYSEKILRCHLGIIIPEGCSLKVNGEVRGWEEGKCMVFDDTFRHEAWNSNYDKTRIVLMVDFNYEGSSEDRNPDFFRKSKTISEEQAIVSREIINAMVNLGSEVNNMTQRSQV